MYSEDHSQVFGPYTGSGIDETGDFWSHTVFADTVVVEYLADRQGETVPFSITRIAHLMASEQTMAAGTCELDVTCYSPWGGIASGVGMYIFETGGASYQCSGALVNNGNHDSKPYFLTANHCISTAAMAKTVEVFWKYQTSTCNGTGPGLSGVPTTLGATYLAGAPIPSGDFSLILLSQLPNSNLTFYGWNAGSTALPMGGLVAGMHHPQGDYTRIVFGSRNPDAAAQIGTSLAPASVFYQIQATSGRIEPGSSGSPLFTADESIVGTLTYGPSGDACSTSPFTAGYARFSVAYPSLSQYLSPTPVVAVTPVPASLSASWTIGSPAPAAQTVQVEHHVDSGGAASRDGDPSVDRAFGEQFEREPVEARRVVGNLEHGIVRCGRDVQRLNRFDRNGRVHSHPGNGDRHRRGGCDRYARSGVSERELDHRESPSGGANRSSEHHVDSGGAASRDGDPSVDRAFGEQFEREPVEARRLVGNLEHGIVRCGREVQRLESL